jgi:hypothetical protein
MMQIDEIVGRAALIRRCRATFSPREKDCSSILDSCAFEEGRRGGQTPGL